MFVINCPNCGRRGVTEFRWGGELSTRNDSRKPQAEAPSPEPLYLRENALGVIREWWYHRAGCGEWLIAHRHTKTNEVTATYFFGEGPGGDVPD